MHNKSLQFKLNVISITINIIAIAMMFTFQYRYSVETVVYNENIWFGMFNLTGGNLVSLIQNSPDVVDEKFWGKFLWNQLYICFDDNFIIDILCSSPIKLHLCAQSYKQ